MTTVRALAIGNQALLARAELERLIELAGRSEPVQLEIEEEDLPTVGLAWLADRGGAFDFWQDEDEAIYTIEDGEPV
jgi:hypothetical protein